MTRYTVIGLVDATVAEEYEAESSEEAFDKALANMDIPTICHQCASEIDIGDVTKFIVINEETGQEEEF